MPPEDNGQGPTLEEMGDAELAQLLGLLEMELGRRGWRPQRTWSKPAADET